MRNHFTSVVLAGLPVVTSGCQSDHSPSGGGGSFQSRDSAGIEIVESAAPAWDGDGWTVPDTPTVVIGRM